MRLPRLLDGNMNELARLNPSRLSATVNLEPLSTATMVLPAGEPSVSVRQYVEIYKDDDSLGVYRVSSVRTAYGDSQEVSLEHGITVLEDCITPEDTELTGSFRSIISTLLGYQAVKLWQLGTVDVPAIESLTLTTSGDLCLQAVISLMEMVKGYGLFFDQTTSPWTLHVRRLETEPSCECRMSRNMSSVTIALDEAELVTRAVSSKLPGGYQDGPTASAWGVIARPLSIDDEATEAEAVKQAKEYLDTYKDPAITVEIDALELAQLTGESLDAFTSGKLCRTALPDFGVTVDERVNSLYYEDLLHAPHRVRLTLATPARTIQRSLAGLRRAQETTKKTVYRNSVKIIKTEKELLVQAEELTVQAAKLTAQAAEILLKADKITLQGYVTIDEFEARVAEIERLVSGLGTISTLLVNNLMCIGSAAFSGSLNVGGVSVAMQEQKVITAVSGRGVTGEYKTLQYLNWDGEKASTSVCTGITQAAFSNTQKTLRFVGAPVV